MPIPVLSPDQSDAWDRQAEAAGVPRPVLMNAAGRAVAAIAAARMPLAAARGVLVAAGAGNNGGDGWVAARALHRAGIATWVTSAGGAPGELCAAARALALADGVREVAPDGPWPAVGLAIDALLGTGARGAPRASFAALIERLTDLAAPIVAIDGPTGVDLATGVVHGAAPVALSITFGGLRRGHLLARDEVGDIVVADIGHPPPAAWPTLMSDAIAAAQVPPFPAGAHKGMRGRVVIVGGDAGMAGAARMVARAAFATGAGLVHVACPAESAAVLQTAEPDVQTVVQDFAAAPSAALRDLLDRANAVVVGPGLGRGAGRRELVTAIMAHAGRVVLDADGLIALQGSLDALAGRTADRPCVLTPHPGEFRALWPALAAAAETDPWGAAESAASGIGAGCAVLLKGVPTVVAATGRAPVTVAAGNPGLATGGSGDLLSGIIGCLLAQGVEPPLAAAAAAQALGRAADIAARRHTARGMRPVDVVRALPDLWREWELLRRAPPTPLPPVILELPAPARV